MVLNACFPLFFIILIVPFSSLSEETIMDIIASLMVLPNRMCIPLIDQVKVDQMRFPLPRVRKVFVLFGSFIFSHINFSILKIKHYTAFV